MDSDNYIQIDYDVNNEIKNRNKRVTILTKKNISNIEKEKKILSKEKKDIWNISQNIKSAQNDNNRNNNLSYSDINNLFKFFILFKKF